MFREQFAQLGAHRPDDEFRLTIFGRPTGPWHPDKDAAERYAVKRKLASHDVGLGITFMDVSASFARRRKVAGPPQPTGERKIETREPA